MIQIIDASIIFITTFECAVMSRGVRSLAFAQRMIVSGHSEYSSGARIDDFLDHFFTLAGGFKHIDGADNVNHCTLSRVGATNWDLKPGKMDNMTHAVFLNEWRERFWISDVAENNRGSSNFFIVHNQSQASRIRTLVE